MNILVIDTASEFLSLSLEIDNTLEIVFEKVHNKQSEYIIAKIQDLLKLSNKNIYDINLILYNQGPGSFTGLRIGLSATLGIAFGLNINVVPISTFLLYAYEVNKRIQQKKVYVLLDAKLDEAYVAGVDLEDYTYFLEPQLVKNYEFILNDLEYVIVGSDELLGRKVLNEDIMKHWITITYPDSINMLNLYKLKNFTAIKPIDADLLYVRDKIALTINEQNHLKKL